MSYTYYLILLSTTALFASLLLTVFLPVPPLVILLTDSLRLIALTAISTVAKPPALTIYRG